MAKKKTTGPAAEKPGKLKPVRDYALFLLERCDRTASEMRRKLRDKGYEPDEIEEALRFLTEYRFIDDAEYAKRFIRSYSSTKSILRMRKELEQKGVARFLIDEAFCCFTVDEEAQIAALLAKKGIVPRQQIEWKQYQKVMAFLYRRGYSAEVIGKAMDRLEVEFVFTK